MTIVLDSLNEEEFISFAQFFNPEGRMGVVVADRYGKLCAKKIIDFVQHELFAPIMSGANKFTCGGVKMSEIKIKQIVEAAILPSDALFWRN